jgi:hypothetical protein
MPSVKRSVFMHREGKTFMLWESNSMIRVLKNRENPLQFLGYMKNERRV